MARPDRRPGLPTSKRVIALEGQNTAEPTGHARRKRQGPLGGLAEEGSPCRPVWAADMMALLELIGR